MQFTESNLKLHVFTTTIGEHCYIYEIIKMRDSVMVFVNLRNNREFNDFSVAMKNPYDSLPVGTKIMGNFTEDNSKEMAQRTSKKLGKTVFLSLNILPDKYILPLIEKQLFLEIKDKPDMF